MFNPARWRGDKSNKITALFKLRFHATEVSQFGGNALVLSLVPVDNGKPTAKLEKSVIRDECCYWENPVFERVKLVQDQKTGQIHDKIYHFIVSTRSSKYSIVGDVTVNIADYFSAKDVASVSLPFKSSDSDAVLHISIQRIEENAIEREMEDEAARIKSQDRSLKKHLSIGDAEESINKIVAEEEPLRKTVSNIADLNSDRRAASTGSDITLSSSDSSSGVDTPRDNGLKNSNMLVDSSKQPAVSYNQQSTRSDWALASIHDQLSTTTEDYPNSPRDAFSSSRSHLGLDESGDKFKSDLVILSRKAELSDLELNTLRKQIVKESRRIQELLREVASLKEEKNAVTKDYEKLKASSKRVDDLKAKNTRGFEGDPWTLLDETRQELSYEKNLNSNLRIQLMKTQESNTELIMAVQDLEHMLDLKSSGTQMPTTNSFTRRSCEKLVEVVQDPQCHSDVDEEQQALEDIVKQHSDVKDTYILEQKIMDLCSEIEMYRRDKDELEMQMEQLALDYEIIKQENHELSRKLDKIHMSEQLNIPYESSSPYAAMKDLHSQVQKLENELKARSNDYSNSLARIKDLESQVLILQDQVDKQTEGFKVTLAESVSLSEAEKEKLANEAEEALRLTRSELESRIGILEGKLNTHSKEFSTSLATIKDLELHIEELEEDLVQQAEKEKLVNEAEEALRLTRIELENRIGILEGKLNTQSNEFSTSLATIKELELHIKELEEDLEQQAQGFIADLETLTCAKVAEEKRAIKAEEALRLSRLKTVHTAEMLQDEFQKLSMQMQSTFEANVKVSSNAVNEASELKLLNSHLKEELWQAKEEVQLVRDEQEALVLDLRSQMSSKLKQIDQLEEDIQRTELENNKLEEQVSALKDELEEVTALANERQLLLQRTELENNKLEAQIVSEKQVAEKLLEELNKSNSGCQHDTDAAMLKQIESMRVQNIDMESELKEMQERYTELSLKFAEVEGDRQRLMMTLRSLKNAKKS